MNAILKKLSLIIAFSFVAIVLSLIVYAIVPSDTKFEQIWATDNKQYERAYATLATNDESVIGVLTLAYTLREVHSKYPLVILVSHQVTEPYLRVLQHPFLRSKIVIIEKIEPPSSTKIGVAAWREALTKLKIWTLTDYKKVMYLDADQIILQNIDEWFDRPTLTGTVNQDITCVPAAEKTSSQGGLNAALLIFEPNITVYYRMIKLLNNGNSWGDSDQGIISHYFESVESSMHLLPMPETTFARCCHAPWFNRTLLRVVHFTHFALNYQKVAAEMQEEPHLKNWDGIPNCDSDFYIMWKRTYHRVMAIVNEAHDIREIKERRNPFWMLIAFTSIMGIVYLLYTRRSQSSSQ